MFHPKNTTLFSPFAPLFRVPVIYLLVLLGLNFKPINIASISENWICNLEGKGREGKGRGGEGIG
jgi:hypothetical protein